MSHAFLVKVRLPCPSNHKGTNCGKSQDADGDDDAKDTETSIRMVERVDLVP